MAPSDFFLAIFISGTNGDVAAFLDEAIGGFGEEGAVLNVVVTDQVKGPSLGEDGSVIVDRAVVKVVRKTRMNPIAVDELKELTVAEDGAGFRTENQKGVASALDVMNRDGVGLLGYRYRA